MRNEKSRTEWFNQIKFLNRCDLIINHRINKNRFLSLDEGFDRETQRKVWGSDYGELIFSRVRDFRGSLRSDWNQRNEM